MAFAFTGFCCNLRPDGQVRSRWAVVFLHSPVECRLNPINQGLTHKPKNAVHYHTTALNMAH